jgi:1-acyl-sn-glycerol-3-phosphate acyltransferase
MSNPASRPSRWRIAPRLLGMSLVMLAALIEYVFRALHRAPAAVRAHWLHRWSGLALKAVGVEFVLEGKAPHDGLLIANHQGYLDILVLSAAMPVVFVSKQEVQEWPAFGVFAKLSGTLFVDRSRRADVGRLVREMDSLREAGVLMALFPEGTTSDGTGLLPFKTPLLEPFCASKSPVWSSALRYWIPSDNSGAQVAWVGDDSLAPHLLNLLTKPKIEARLTLDPEPLVHPNRKELAILLREKVLRLLSLPIPESAPTA